MSLGPNDIKKIAHLARLAILDEDITPLIKDLDNILALVGKMNEEDTSQTVPLSHPSDATQPMRPDVVSETDQRKLMQAIAPDVKAGLYIVPQFVETE